MEEKQTSARMPRGQRSDNATVLRVLRIAQNLTQAELASKVGIEQADVSYLEAGNTRRLAEYSAKIARILGVAPEDLLRTWDEYCRARGIAS